MTMVSVVARLVGALLYSGDVCAQTEALRRTGLPAIAGHDSEDVVAPRPLPNRHALAFPRRNLRPSLARQFTLSNRGRREDRVLAAPMAPVRRIVHGVGTTGSAETTRPSLRNGLTAYTYPPRCAGLVSHRRRSDHHPSDLAPASGRQDHTISPSCPSRSSARKQAATPTGHRIPPQRS